MKALVEQVDGSYKWEEKGDPVCGVDFCDTCGDCLVCSWEDSCISSDEHVWVIYRENE